MKKKVYIEVRRCRELYTWAIYSADEERSLESSGSLYFSAGEAENQARMEAKSRNWRIVSRDNVNIDQALDKLADDLQEESG